jgi:putative ABC transport system substrate-binding protein
MMIIRAALAAALTLGLLAAPLVGEAEQPARSSRIGILSSSSTGPPRAFTQGLSDLAYVEGQNIVIERRNAKSYEELPRLAAELVRLKVDVIFAPGSPAAQVARDSIQTIPVVFVTFADPVRTGLVASLARPGRNLTGLTMISAELAGKRLELLRKAFPKVSHVAVLVNPANASSGEQLQETQSAARSLGMRLDAHEARAPRELEGAFAAMRRKHADALFILPDTMFFTERRRIAELAEKSRLPAMAHWRAYVEAGGLMAYGPSFADANRRAAVYVDRILKGAKPADLPVEQPTKFELVINMKTAKVLGLTIPQSILSRADEIIQ